MATIDELVIEIKTRSTDASPQIAALAQSLASLKQATKGGAGLTTVSNQFAKFANALKGLPTDSNSKVAEIVSSLKPLETIGKSNLGSALNQLKKIPEITNSLDADKLSEFANKIQQVTIAVKPLADEMNKVSLGFSKLPANIQRAINANARLTKSNKTTAFGFNMLAAKIGVYLYAIRRVSRVLAGWIKESNDYVENLNLFYVAMGKYADQAQKYAEKVGGILGIDPSEFMRYQAVFQNMATGFGVAGDKAAIMSKNLTQLGYDLASVFNVKFNVAMEKLESALAGQPRPMREWGFDLSEATLKTVALGKGIKGNVEKMTQLEKSQLRYVQLIETAQRLNLTGDMARTLEAPANQLRILKAQAVQASRALGNIFIPALNAVLPYAIAFLKVVRWAANELANLFGFSLPEIDYSGIEYVAGGTEEISDGFDEANSAAQELKKTILGFDQLNMLNAPTVNSSGGSGSNIGTGGDLGLDLPEYDFLGGLIETKTAAIFDKWKKDAEPFVKFLVDNFDVIKTTALVIGGILLAWKVGSALTTFIEGLSGLQGKTIGITMAIAGIGIGASGISGLVSGSGDIKDVIKTFIGSALGIGGSLLAFGTGPLGWSIAVGVVLTMSVIGLKMGLAKNIDKIIEESMGSGNTTITALSKAFSDVMSSIAAGYEPIIENGAKLTKAQNDVKGASKALSDAFALIDSGAVSAEESVGKITELFNQLVQSTEVLRTQAYNNITYALSTSLKDTAAAMGVDVAEIMFQLDTLNARSSGNLQEYVKKQKELRSQYDSGKISAEKYTKELEKLASTLGISSSTTDIVDNSFRNLMITLEGIDWQNESDRAAAVLQIGESADEAQKNAQAAFEVMKDDIAELRKYATTEGEHMALDEMLRLAKADTDAAGERIRQNVQDVYSILQIDLVKKLGTVAEDAQEAWAGMTPTEKWLAGGSEASFVASALAKYNLDYIAPILSGLESELSEFGVTGSNWLSGAFQEILANGFEWGFNGSGGYVKGYSEDLVDLIERAIGSAEKELNRNPLKIAAKLDLQNPTIKSTTNGISKTIGSVRMTAYKDGGFPVPGELFLARESGPEMVGSVGGRTAVANNDQIVEAVSRGVAEAVKGSMGQGGDINVYVDGVLTKSVSAIERKNTRAGRTVIPVGV